MNHSRDDDGRETAIVQPVAKSTPASKAMYWTGWIVTILPVLALLMGAAGKFSADSPEIAKGFEHLGWPLHLAVPLGVLELICTLLYLIPQTSVVGAILLTGYMGGAIATHVRLEEAFYLQAAFGVLIWLGIYLREPRLRELLPLRR